MSDHIPTRQECCKNIRSYTIILHGDWALSLEWQIVQLNCTTLQHHAATLAPDSPVRYVAAGAGIWVSRVIINHVYNPFYINNWRLKATSTVNDRCGPYRCALSTPSPDSECIASQHSLLSRWVSLWLHLLGVGAYLLMGSTITIYMSYISIIVLNLHSLSRCSYTSALCKLWLPYNIIVVCFSTLRVQLFPTSALSPERCW